MHRNTELRDVLSEAALDREEDEGEEPGGSRYYVIKLDVEQPPPRQSQSAMHCAMRNMPVGSYIEIPRSEKCRAAAFAYAGRLGISIRTQAHGAGIGVWRTA